MPLLPVTLNLSDTIFVGCVIQGFYFQPSSSKWAWLANGHMPRCQLAGEPAWTAKRHLSAVCAGRRLEFNVLLAKFTNMARDETLVQDQAKLWL